MRAARESIDRFDAVAKTTPPVAAQRIITGIEKNQPRILIGNDARFMDLLQRFRPATYWAVLAKRIEKMAGEEGEVRFGRCTTYRSRPSEREDPYAAAVMLQKVSRRLRQPRGCGVSVSSWLGTTLRLS